MCFRSDRKVAQNGAMGTHTVSYINSVVTKLTNISEREKKVST